jgi:hypothetical protein
VSLIGANMASRVRPSRGRIELSILYSWAESRIFFRQNGLWVMTRNIFEMQNLVSRIWLWLFGHQAANHSFDERDWGQYHLLYSNICQWFYRFRIEAIPGVWVAEFVPSGFWGSGIGQARPIGEMGCGAEPSEGFLATKRFRVPKRWARIWYIVIWCICLPSMPPFQQKWWWRLILFRE